MPANAAVYLPSTKISLQGLPKITAQKGSTSKSDAYFEFDVGDDKVRLSAMPGEQIPGHLQGFTGYVNSLPATDEQKEEATSLLQQTKLVLGLHTDGDFDSNPDIWKTLLTLAKSNGGFVFAFNSVIDTNGDVIIGPPQNAG
ncbi:MAG: hypothetical protein AAF517_11905 [Planctomycetota bacterium]